MVGAFPIACNIAPTIGCFDFHSVVSVIRSCEEISLDWKIMQNAQNIVRSEVVETTFNLLSDAEKRSSLSVCKIESHSSLDANGRAIPG